MLATPALLLEYEAVLSRAEQRVVHRLTDQDLELALRALAAICEPVQVYFQWRPQLHDQDDEMVLETAINGRADALVTHNRADFAAGARVFGTRILMPSEFLREVEA